MEDKAAHKNTVMENLDAVADATTGVVGVPVSGIIFFGFPVSDWIIIGTGILLVLNIGTKLLKIVAGLGQRIRECRGSKDVHSNSVGDSKSPGIRNRIRKRQERNRSEEDSGEG